MSRSQLARTPDNFPRMKHRAAGRLAKQRLKLIEQLPEILAVFSRFVNDAVDSLIYVFTAVARAVAAPPTVTQADVALA